MRAGRRRPGLHRPDAELRLRAGAEARPIVPPPGAAHCAVTLTSSSQRGGGGAARTAAGVAAMDLGGCSASQARTHVGRGPTTGDQAVLSGPELRETSGPGRELGRRGCPGDRGSGGREAGL